MTNRARRASGRLALALCASSLHAALALALAQPAAAEADGSERRAVTEALARYRREPSVRELVAAVHAREASSSEGLADRARLSGWVPTVGLKARRGQQVDLASTTNNQALRLSTDDDLTLEAALTFDLGRVVFAREEVAIARQAQAERERTSERAREVIALYFERRRLQVERDLLQERARARGAAAPNEDGAEPESAPARPRGRARGEGSLEEAIAARDVRIAEIEALLDSFTGGAFRRMMARSRAAEEP